MLLTHLLYLYSKTCSTLYCKCKSIDAHVISRIQSSHTACNRCARAMKTDWHGRTQWYFGREHLCIDSIVFENRGACCGELLCIFSS